MAVQDIRSNLIAQFMGALTTIGDGTAVFLGEIDTAKYELGVMFAFSIFDDDTTAVVTVNFQDKEELADDYVDISFENPNFLDQIIGTNILNVKNAAVTTIVTTTSENRIQTIGLISSKRFVRVQLIVTGSDDTSAVTCYVTQMAEDMPTAEPDEAS